MTKFTKVSLFIGAMLLIALFYPLFKSPTDEYTSTASDEIRLTKGVEVKHPALGQDFITWIEYRDGAYNLYLFDYISKKESKLNIVALSSDTIGPVVYQNHIYWVDHSAEGWVFTDYNVDYQTTKKLKTETNAVYSLAVYENYLVYEGKSGNSTDVFVLEKNSGNGINPEVRNLTNDDAHQRFPTMYGQYIAWAEFPQTCETTPLPNSNCGPSKYGKVVTYDIVSNYKKVLFENLPNLSNVKIANLTLSWSYLEGSTQAVKVYYINTGAYITVSPADNHSFDPILVGDLIAYFVNRANGTDLDLYQFSTGQRRTLSWSKATKKEITIGASSRYVAWVDNRLGVNDIFYYDAQAEAPQAGLNQSSEKIDQDNDGLRDSEEAKYGTNSFSADTDNDGLTDSEEIKRYHTYPTQYDSDGDGISDGDEVLRWSSNPLKFDSNNDGIDDKTSIIQGYNPMANRDKLHAYRVQRMEDLNKEKELAVYLKKSLDHYLGRGRWHTSGARDWFKVVNAYIYGGYNIKEIGAYVKGDKNAVSADTLATVWREEKQNMATQKVYTAIK